MGLKRFGWLAAVLAMGAMALPASASAELVVNGDFETGTLAGWTTSTIGNGSWFAYAGTANPAGSEFAPPVPPPPQGSFAAISAENNPGTHVLYQDVPLGPGPHLLSLLAYYQSEAPILVPTPDTLSTVGEPNQQFRIDVMKPSAPLTSLEPSDILATIFATKEGDPEAMTATPFTVDLSAFAGQTVRLRMVEVDNQNFFNAGIDAVSVSGSPPPPPPPPAPSNAFTFGKLKLNKQKGTATLKVNVPGAGTLVAVDVKKKGKRVKRATATATAVGLATLKLNPTGSGKKTLKEKGKLPFNLSVTFTPTGGTAASQAFSGKLKLKRSS